MQVGFVTHPLLTEGAQVSIARITRGLKAKGHTATVMPYTAISGKPDVLHAFWASRTGYDAMLYGQAHGIPVVLQDDLQPGALNHAQFLRAIARCQAYAANNKSIADQIGDKAFIVPNAIDPSEFEEGIKDLPYTHPIIASCGIFDPRKGLETLLKAFKALLVQIPTATLLLIGTGYYPGYIEHVAKEYELGDHLQITGHVPHSEVLTYLRACDVYVCASEHEGSSNAVREAMLAGLPVYATNTGDHKDLLKPAFLFEANNHRHLSICLDVFFDSDLPHIGRDNRAKVLAEYQPEQELDGYLEVYNYARSVKREQSKV